MIHKDINRSLLKVYQETILFTCLPKDIPLIEKISSSEYSIYTKFPHNLCNYKASQRFVLFSFDLLRFILLPSFFGNKPKKSGKINFRLIGFFGVNKTQEIVIESDDSITEKHLWTGKLSRCRFLVIYLQYLRSKLEKKTFFIFDECISNFEGKLKSHLNHSMRPSEQLICFKLLCELNVLCEGRMEVAFTMSNLCF